MGVFPTKPSPPPSCCCLGARGRREGGTKAAGGRGRREARRGAPRLAPKSPSPAAVTHNKKLMAMAAERDRRLGWAGLGSARLPMAAAAAAQGGRLRGERRGAGTWRHRLPSRPLLAPFGCSGVPQPKGTTPSPVPLTPLPSHTTAAAGLCPPLQPPGTQMAPGTDRQHKCCDSLGRRNPFCSVPCPVSEIEHSLTNLCGLSHLCAVEMLTFLSVNPQQGSPLVFVEIHVWW